MKSTTRLVLLSISLFFLLLPLAVPRPGMPPTLKADEPAYYLMALSLLEDGDLLCETSDLRRLFNAYPLLPVENLIILSTDGWKTVYFGKPYLYSALAAPAAALAGARGMVAFNMALFLGMIWMGFLYLRQFNSEPVAAFFVTSFFFLSTAFVYVFWLHTEILNMFSVTAAYFFTLYEFDSTPSASRSGRALARVFNTRSSAIWSGVALSPALYNKPVLAILALPILFVVLQRQRWKGVVIWTAALVISLGLIVGGSVLLIGEPTPYLGTSRVAVNIEDPEMLDSVLERFRVPKVAKKRLSSWRWLALAPQLRPHLLIENAGYFLWGRHTGLVLYMPFAVISVILFLLHRRRSVSRWLIVGSAAGLAFFFLVWIFFNFHGGGGFIGNRYFVNAYPVFLFLVTAVRPRWITTVGFVAAGLFLSPILFTPYGAPVPEPTLQAHARSTAFNAFPLELSIRKTVPGYRTMTFGEAHFIGRQDLFRVVERDKGIFWVRGATTAEILMLSLDPLSTLRFKVATLASDNEVVLRVGRAHNTIRFSADEELEDPWVPVELQLAEPFKTRIHDGDKVYIYRLEVSTTAGRNPRRPDGQWIQPSFYMGAAIRYFGADQESPR